MTREEAIMWLEYEKDKFTWTEAIDMAILALSNPIENCMYDETIKTLTIPTDNSKMVAYTEIVKLSSPNITRWYYGYRPTEPSDKENKTTFVVPDFKESDRFKERPIPSEPNDRIHVIPSDRSKQFIENFNKNKPTKEFVESCRKAGKLFGYHSAEPSDLISRAEVHKVLSLLATEGGKDAKLLFSDAHESINNLPSVSADSDDLIIKNGKGIQDGLYNIKDGEIFKYKAKGGTVRAYKLVECVSAERVGEWLTTPTAWVYCSICGAEPPNESNERTPYCSNCGAKMKGGAE